jgi:CDP-glycerol glycerophosphotransferase (TagB/SpsB family)
VRGALKCTHETLFLWLPTYRQATSTGRVDGNPYAGMLPVSDATTLAVDRWLAANDAWMLAKPHPLSPRPPEGVYERITVIDEDWLAERGLTLYESLAAADCLITDASAVWVDFLLADKPLICAFPDAEEYRRSRGIHLEPYEVWIPGPLVTGPTELREEMERVAAGQDPFRAARRRMRVRLHKHDDARSTERLLDALGL